MEGLKNVNKLMGESVSNVINIPSYTASHYYGKRPRVLFSTYRAKFCKNLRIKGYETKSQGNYIIATRNGETVKFYFAAHNPQHHNYLISKTLENEVDYYAFYNDKIDVVYLVGYGIVRKYCKTLNTAYTFYGNTTKQKLFIPDEWAKQQQVNTYII